MVFEKMKVKTKGFGKSFGNMLMKGAAGLSEGSKKLASGFDKASTNLYNNMEKSKKKKCKADKMAEDFFGLS